MKKVARTEQPFYSKLAQYMVREDKNCWQASVELELGLTQDECVDIMKNSMFQTILRSERMKLYNELAQNPMRTKHTLIGQAVVCVEKLMEAEQYEKAMNAIVNLAKIEGWVGSDTNINVFAGLSSKELADMKAKLKGSVQTLPPADTASA